MWANKTIFKTQHHRIEVERAPFFHCLSEPTIYWFGLQIGASLTNQSTAQLQKDQGRDWFPCSACGLTQSSFQLATHRSAAARVNPTAQFVECERFPSITWGE